MPKPPPLVPLQEMRFSVRLPLYLQLQAHLYSELESRVPYGAYNKFFGERIREFFTSRRLDLAPFLGSAAGAFTVTGERETIDALETYLKGMP